MSSGKASVFSPAYSPIFSPDATRGATRVRLQGGGYGPVSSGPCEMPPFSFPGVIFSPSSSLRSVVYSPFSDERVVEVVSTLVQSPSAAGIQFQLMRGGATVLWTSPVQTSLFQLNTASIGVFPNDELWVRVSNDGSEDAIGLNIMFRYCAAPAAL